MKTIKEWIDGTPEPYRMLIWANKSPGAASENALIQSLDNAMRSFLMSRFYRGMGGAEFWYKLQNGKLPEIPAKYALKCVFEVGKIYKTKSKQTAKNHHHRLQPKDPIVGIVNGAVWQWNHEGKCGNLTDVFDLIAPGAEKKKIPFKKKDVPLGSIVRETNTDGEYNVIGRSSDRVAIHTRYIGYKELADSYEIFDSRANAWKPCWKHA